MIKSIGCDMVDISRLTDKLSNEKFINKVFTIEEKKYIDNHSKDSAAGIWAAKESVSKALGTGFVKVQYKDIEILHSDSGQPFVKLYKQANIKLQKLNAKHIYLSISHEDNKAMAFVIIE